MIDATKEVCLKVHLNDPMKLTVKNETFLCKSVEVIDANDVVHRFKFNKTLEGCNRCEAEDTAKVVSPPKEDESGSEVMSGRENKGKKNGL